MRTIDDLLDKILSGGCDVEIGASKTHGLLLVVKPETRLSNIVGTVIRNEGFRFRYCYSGVDGKPVIIFWRQQWRSGLDSRQHLITVVTVVKGIKKGWDNYD